MKNILYNDIDDKLTKTRTDRHRRLTIIRRSVAVINEVNKSIMNCDVSKCEIRNITSSSYDESDKLLENRKW